MMDQEILCSDHPEDPQCSDFTLNGDSAWIKVGSVSIYIRRVDNKVLVELLPRGDEADGAMLDSASAQC